MGTVWYCICNHLLPCGIAETAVETIVEAAAGFAVAALNSPDQRFHISIEPRHYTWAPMEPVSVADEGIPAREEHRKSYGEDEQNAADVRGRDCPPPLTHSLSFYSRTPHSEIKTKKSISSIDL